MAMNRNGANRFLNVLHLPLRHAKIVNGGVEPEIAG
jgi:hypothetical protein